MEAKRLFDLVIGTALLLAALPILIIMAVLVGWRLGTPVLFKHERPGLRGRAIRLEKFRTMTNANGRPWPDHRRFTPFGKWLRASSVDDLPELWNVLKWQTSLVGPRAVLIDYLPLPSPDAARRHEVLPGVTGWAQDNGRNALSWDENFSFELW